MRVLIVEDEVRLARNVASVLGEVAGYAVDLSHDGEDGRHMAMTNRSRPRHPGPDAA